MIIGILGKKSSGKTTLAQAIAMETEVSLYAFADPLKSVCEIVYGLDWDQLHGDKKEVIDPRYNCTPRQIMQFVGTELFRKNPLPSHASNVWIDCFHRTVKGASGVTTLIHDVRFKDEAAAIKEAGGVLIRVTRPSLVSTDTHSSETESDTIVEDVIFDNSGTLDDVARWAAAFIRSK